MSDHLRADRLLVERGLFESRARAQAAIDAGRVTADGEPVRKPSEELAVDAVLHAEPAHPWVSRGGVKLDDALNRLEIPIEGRVCLDVGASTGGFTEVLLSRGARRVYAVDVGRDQLHPRLRARPEVVSYEETDIRTLSAARLPEKPEVVVVDVSFISLKLVLRAALALATTPVHLLALIKPQFEAPRGLIKKGIVRDPDIHAAVCEEITAFLYSLRCDVVTVFPAAITGGDGNQEFFIGARRD
jgi:23S rRNA (cytidine1920-2'-O)/16S rRNA (cytidine1409-2'-O)-methyltransferase